jgi:hypothetical protein
MENVGDSDSIETDRVTASAHLLLAALNTLDLVGDPADA